jgi:integrase
VLDRWLVEYVDRKELRSAPIIKAQLDRYVRPKIGGVVVYDLKRSQITAALADIASERVGDLVLGHLRCALAWWALRDDNFTSPIVRGMRGRPKTRDRVLDDEELRDFWQALAAIEGDKPETLVAPYFRLLLLTACRRAEVAQMRECEMNRRSNMPMWTIPASRYKTKKDHTVPLSDTLLALLPKPDRRGFMFGKRKPGYSWMKLAVDQAIAAIREHDERPAMPRWTIHDIRRTAATLMTRAGVRPDVVERVLGHAIGSHVHRIYNRHDFEVEKTEALGKLAEIVNRIVHPGINIVPFVAA